MKVEFKSAGPKYEKYTTILRSRIDSSTLHERGSINPEDRKLDEKNRVSGLIDGQRKRLFRNVFCISLTKSATYLFKETILNNWSDTSLLLLTYITSSALLILITPLFVPLILRNYTIRSSIRLSVIWMTLIVLTTYRPFPYVFILQTLLTAFPESVLCVALPLYIVRIAKIWSRINGTDLRTMILRLFALQNILHETRHVFIATINYAQPLDETKKAIHEMGVNVSCGSNYCKPSKNLIGNYVWSLKYKSSDDGFILSLVFAILSALMSLGLTVMIDRLNALSTSEFGDQPRACKPIDVFLQLCRPRMTYLLGISLYGPFLIILQHEYLEAYATCSLPAEKDQMMIIVISIATIHATLSAEIFLDILGIVRSLQFVIGLFMIILLVLEIMNDMTLNVIPIFLVFYMLRYCIAIYGLFVVLLTQQLIGDQEVAAWGIHAFLYSVGIILSQAFRYMCMNVQLKVMIFFGISVLLMTFFLRREMRKTLVRSMMSEKIIDALRRRNKAWISDSSVLLDKAIDIGGNILWVETFWRRTVQFVVISANDADAMDNGHHGSKRKVKLCGFFEQRS